jgi:hypothetical protein
MTHLELIYHTVVYSIISFLYLSNLAPLSHLRLVINPEVLNLSIRRISL